MKRIIGNECEYIDVFFSDFEAGAFSNKTAIDKSVVNLELSFGNIANVSDPKSRNKDYKYSFFNFKRASYIYYNDFLIKEHGLKRLKETDKKIRFWAGKRSSNELCGLYYLVSELKDKELYLFDIPVYEEARHIYEDTTIFLGLGSKGIRGIDGVGSDSPLDGLVFHKLGEEEKIEYSSNWTRLVSENGDIRVYIPGSGIVSMKYGDFYGSLLESLGDDGREAIKIVEEYLSCSKEPQLNICQLKAILGKMIKDGIVDTVEVLEKDLCHGLISPIIRRKVNN